MEIFKISKLSGRSLVNVSEFHVILLLPSSACNHKGSVTLTMHQIRFSDLAGGAHDAPPESIVGWLGRGILSPHFAPRRRLRRLTLSLRGLLQGG